LKKLIRNIDDAGKDRRGQSAVHCVLWTLAKDFEARARMTAVTGQFEHTICEIFLISDVLYLNFHT